MKQSLACAIVLFCSCIANIAAGPISDAIDADNQVALITLSNQGTSEDGMTALFMATMSGSTNLVQALLATDAGKTSVNRMMTNADYSGWTALHAAASLDDWSLLKMLWNAGARPSASANVMVEDLIADETVKSLYLALK